MIMSNSENGKIILILVSIFFLYYTVWVFVVPLIDDDGFRSSFYPQNVALMIPVVTGLCFIGGLIIFTLYHIRPHLGIK